MNKTMIGAGAALGLLAVMLGALGAHALRDLLAPDSLESYQTGVQYQMYHALFLLFLGLHAKLPRRERLIAFRLVAVGVLCFSGSIYALSTAALTGLDFTPVAWVTPLGGLFLIAGWAWLLYRTLFESPGT
jgi:uncharacterized membrane protein YgdD (TMEM256/DUF423 family)